MRTFLLFCFTTAFGFSPMSTFSQNSKIKIETDQTITVAQIFELIQEQSNGKFIYSDYVIAEAPVVELKKGVILIKDLLKKGLSPIGCTYEFTNNETIIIKKETISQQTSGIVQQVITGIVTDENNIPLPGAAILIKGTSRGIIADSDGRFTITADVNDVLVFRFLGFETQEIIVTSETYQLSILLKESTNSLDEVVIRTGYQTLEKVETTGSIEVVSQKAIESRITTDVTSRLEGIVAGLLIENETEGDPTIIVGGITTFSDNKQPLIVVDGIPLVDNLSRMSGTAKEATGVIPKSGSGINGINPNDIESISVLKDAAAASIWGARASNGVVVITTKSGKGSGGLNITYNSDMIITTKPNLDRLNYASASDAIDWRLEAIELGVLDDEWQRRGVNNSGFGTTWDDQVNDAWFRLHGAPDYPLFDTGPSWTQEQFDTRISELRKVDGLKQIKDHLFRTAFTQRHNLSFSGATEKNNYYISALFEDVPSIHIGNDYSKYSFNLKEQLKLSDKLRVQLGTMVAFVNRNNNNLIEDDVLFSGTQIGGQLNAYTTIVDANGNLVPTYGLTHSSQTDFYKNLGYVKSTRNPIEEINNADNTNKKLDLRLSVKLDYDLTSWLNIEGRYGYERSNIKNREHDNEDAYRSRYAKFMFTIVNPDGSLNEQYFPGGTLKENNSLTVANTARGQLNFNKEFRQSNLKALMGIEVIDSKWYFDSDTYYGYRDDNLSFAPYNFVQDWITNDRETYAGAYGNAGSIELQPINQRFPYLQVKNFTNTRSASYFSNINYTYDNKYIAYASVRIDHTSINGASERLKYNPLWSAGISWNIHNEDFFEIPWIQLLKPRFSYGYNGKSPNIGLSSFLTLATKNVTDFNYNFRPSAIISNYPNPDLRWETTRTINIGLDFVLKSNVLSASIDFYKKESKDLIVNEKLNLTYGYGARSPLTNSGIIENKGLDINLVARIFNRDNFNWTSNLIFSYSTNKVIEADIYAPLAHYYVDNPRNYVRYYPVDALWTYKFAGLDDTGTPRVYMDINDPESITDDPFFVWLQADFDALNYAGRTTPKYFGGLTNNFSFKNFTLSTRISYKFGHVFQRPSFDMFDTYRFLPKEINDRWKNPGDEAHTNIPGMQAIANASFQERNLLTSMYSSSDATVEDASHIRLNNISLSYSFKDEFLKKSNLFKELVLTAQANNLGLLWSANKDYDPEYTGKIGNGYSTQYDITPQRLIPGKQFIVGIQVTF